MGVKTLSTGVKLVKMRNPWGVEDYKGDWGDNSSKWTDALAKEVGLVKNKKDGIFYISIEDYQKSFAETQVSYDTTNMKSAHFLRLNDDGTKSEACGGTRKGPNCYRHVLNVKSDVAQKVWMSVHTWDERTLPKSCRTKKGKHGFMTSFAAPHMREFTSGWIYEHPEQFTAGQTVQITLDANWIDKNYAKDWSVVVWGEKGAVSVTHKNGLASDKLPYIAPTGTTTTTLLRQLIRRLTRLLRLLLRLRL